jgi:predicted RNase H-like nuclease
MSMRPSRGAQLPYRLLAGVVPVPGGWLAASAKLQGVTMAPEPPQVFSAFIDVLDYKPAYQVIALFAPVGLLEVPVAKGRTCERAARALLGRPRAGAIASAPVRAVLSCSTYEAGAAANGGRLSALTWRQVKKIAEVDKVIAPYWQRTVFEVHPELSFFQLGEDRAVRFPKHTQAGMAERRDLLAARVPGVERVIDASLAGVTRPQLLDAAACLWTARRILSRAISRLPEDPEWDSAGLRMELVR